MECFLSAFSYEHLVTTFTQLNLACGILREKESRNRNHLMQRSQQRHLNAEGQNKNHLTRADIHLCLHISVLGSNFQPNNTSTQTLQQIRLQTTSYVFLNSCKSETRDHREDVTAGKCIWCHANTKT